MPELVQVVLVVAGCAATLAGALAFVLKRSQRQNETLTVKLIDQVVSETRRGHDRLVDQGRDLACSIREMAASVTTLTERMVIPVFVPDQEQSPPTASSANGVHKKPRRKVG